MSAGQPCIPHVKGGVWPYDQRFEHDIAQSDMPQDVHLVQGYSACIQVCIRPFEPMYKGDDLRLTRQVDVTPPLKLTEVIAWARLVIWENTDNGVRTPHLNVASQLPYLLRARLHCVGDGLSAYMVDYDTHDIRFRLSEDVWPNTIDVPTDLKLFPL